MNEDEDRRDGKKRRLKMAKGQRESEKQKGRANERWPTLKP